MLQARIPFERFHELQFAGRITPNAGPRYEEPTP
jgi:hypothetical protein